MPMSSVWDRVKQLEGKTLRTIVKHIEFEVVCVETDWLTVTPSSGKQRRIYRRWIEHVASKGLDEDALRPGRLSRELPKHRSLSYFGAIVHAVTKA
jgi:hypothetical protein